MRPKAERPGTQMSRSRSNDHDAKSTSGTENRCDHGLCVMIVCDRTGGRRAGTYASGVPRRRAGVLLPLEENILEVGVRRLRDGDPEFYGFAMATELDEADG